MLADRSRACRKVGLRRTLVTVGRVVRDSGFQPCSDI
jgi:hypothetical protein